MRAKETAEITNNKIDLSFTVDKRLREINNGEAAWKTKEWARSNRNQKTTKKFSLDYREYNGGETWKEFFLRISNFMEELFNSDENKIILVTHGYAIGYIIAWWMNFDFTETVRELYVNLESYRSFGIFFFKI